MSTHETELHTGPIRVLLDETDAAGRRLYSDGTAEPAAIPTLEALRGSLRRLRLDPVREEAAPLLVGLGGDPEAGKDTVADHLVDEHGFVKIEMSAPVHESLLTLDMMIPLGAGEVLDIDGRLIVGHARYSELIKAVGYVDAKKNSEVRRLLRALGEDVGRRLDPDLWVKVAAKKIFAARAAGKPVVVTGVRHDNELGLIRKHGGHPVWVARPGLATKSDHSSDNSLDASDFSYQLLNNRSVERLKARTRDLLGFLERNRQL